MRITERLPNKRIRRKIIDVWIRRLTPEHYGSARVDLFRFTPRPLACGGQRQSGRPAILIDAVHRGKHRQGPLKAVISVTSNRHK